MHTRHRSIDSISCLWSGTQHGYVCPLTLLQANNHRHMQVMYLFMHVDMECISETQLISFPCGVVCIWVNNWQRRLNRGCIALANIKWQDVCFILKTSSVNGLDSRLRIRHQELSALTMENINIACGLHHRPGSNPFFSLKQHASALVSRLLFILSVIYSDRLAFFWSCLNL
jgi:hypothetical protein